MKNNINKKTFEHLKNICYEARKLIVEIACKSKTSHIGSCLSEVEILSVLYFNVMNINKNNFSERDRFILSKGHAALGLYVSLYQKGLLPKRYLDDYGKNGSNLCGHPSADASKGIEFSTGSLGHGLPVGLGLALGSKLSKKKWKTFVLLSDGEIDEGSTQEAILFAGHLGIDNLVAIVDYNKIQSFGKVKDILDLEPFADKWRAANWEVYEVDGHNTRDLLMTFNKIKKTKGKPSVIIAHTVKGKGIDFMENTVDWHYLNVTPENLEKTVNLICK